MPTLKSEEIYLPRAILRSISNSVTICDATSPDCVLTYVNPAFELMTGYSAAEAIGQNCRFLHRDDVHQPGILEIRTAIRERREARVMLRNYRKDGSLFWNELHLSLIYDDAGRLTHFLGIQNDVTAQVEATLKSERETTRIGNEANLILRTVGDGIYGLDENGLTTFANPAAEKLTGWTAEEMVGKSQHAMIHHSRPDGTSYPRETCPIYKALRDGQVHSSDGDVFWRKDGTSFPVSYISRPIMVDGRPRGAVVAFKDISVRKRIEMWEKNKNGVLFGISSHLSLKTTLTMIAQAYVDFYPSTAVAVFQVEGGEAVLKAQVGLSEEAQHKLEMQHTESNSAICSRIVAETGRELLTTRNEGKRRHFAEFSEDWVKACLALPVRSTTGELLGVLEIIAPDEAGVDRKVRRSVYNALDLARLAIEHHRLHSELVREHDRAEQALRESEDRFRIMADSCPTMIWVTDADGGSEFINREYRELTGTSMQEMTGDKWRLLLHPDDEARVAETFMKAVRERTSFAMESRIRSAAGEWRYLLSRSEPRLSSVGEFLGHIGVSVDITDRKRAEEMVKESADRLMLATRAGAVGIWDLDVATGTLHWDDQMLRLYGLRREQFTGDYAAWSLAVHPDDRQREAEGFAKTLESGSEFSAEYRAVWPDQTVHIIRAQAMVQRDEAGKAVRVVGTNWDITAQRGAADELMEANRRLQETTAQARELAASAAVANAAKSAFLANMSHEIRTPMNGIIGMIQLLLTTSLTEEQKQYAEIAQSSGKILLALIGDILDLSKIEAGKIAIEDVEFDLPRTLTLLGETWRLQAEAKELTLALDIGAKMPRMVRGDPHRVSQVLHNLLSNAVKFTEHGIVALRVDVVRAEDSAIELRMAVTDSGIGIPLDKQGELFSPFAQADASTTRQFGGTGLGLAICKQLVGLMGGEIGIDSEEGKGSTFWFTLPLTVVAETSATSERQLAAGWSMAGQTLERRNARILVAEDNPTNRLVVMAQLGKLGYEADAVVNGAEAIAALRLIAYDLVLMDCSMPVMDGYEASRTIRAKGNQRTPIVALTAHAMQDDRDKCLQAGMSDFLSKPIDLEELGKMLARWCPPCDCKAPPPKPAIEVEKPQDVFDPEGLLGRLMDDRGLAEIVVKGFVDDFANQLNALRKTLADGDSAAARMAAHTLKGSAATVSACRLSAVAREMEKAAQAGELSRFSELMSPAMGEFERFKATLQQAKWL